MAGAEERTAVLLWKLVSGQGIRVAVVGGSITAAGHLPGGVRHGTGTYGAALILWLQKVSACLLQHFSPTLHPSCPILPFHLTENAGGD